MAPSRIAHRLIGSGGADVVHGHSSHHPLPAEVHQGKLILYGYGDLIHDYEGLSPASPGRSDLVCLDAVTPEKNGDLRHLDVLPFRLQRFRLRLVKAHERARLADFINRPHHHWHLIWPNGRKTTVAR